MINNIIQFLTDHPDIWQIIKLFASEPESIIDILASVAIYIGLIYEGFFSSTISCSQPASPDFTQTQETVCKMNSAVSGSDSPLASPGASSTNITESPNYSESNSSQETLRESSNDP